MPHGCIYQYHSEVKKGIEIIMASRATAMHLMHTKEPKRAPKQSLQVWKDNIFSHSANDLLVHDDGVHGIRYSPMQSRKNNVRTSLSSLSSSTSSPLQSESPKLKIGITEKNENGDGSIYYKDDENRFSQRYTVKLKTFSEYNIVLEVRPPQDLVIVRIGDRMYRKFEKSTDSKKMERAIYKFTWSTNRIRVTERKHRSILPCFIKFAHCDEIQFDIFVKFYFSCEVTHYNGTPFSFIELDYLRKEKNHRNDSYAHNIQFN